MTNESKDNIVYAFFIVDEGLISLENLLISENLSEVKRFAYQSTKDYLHFNGYKYPENSEHATDDGYAMIVRAISGVPANEYQEIVWQYDFDGQISLESFNFH